MAFSYGKKNLANTTLVSSLNSSATSVTVTDASIFPGSYFYATLMPSSEISSLSNSEIVMVTNISGNVLTIIRAQRGTNARSFDAGAVITNGIYSQDLDMAQAVGKKIFTANWDSEAGYYKINDPMLKIVPDEGTSIRVVFDTDVSSGASAALSINENTESGTATKIGKNIEIRDANALVPVSVGLNGDTSQVVTTGKNIASTITQASNYRTSVVLRTDNSLTLKPTASGVCYVNYSFDAEPSTTYTASAISKMVGSTTGFYGMVYIQSLNGSTATYIDNIIWTSAQGRRSKTFTTPANCQKIRLDFYPLDRADSNYQNILVEYSDIQVEKGSSMTAFEPYTGGKAAPSPDWQIPVSTVTGEQTITISDGGSNSKELNVNLGKNLLDGSVCIGDLGITASYNSTTGELSFSGTTQMSWSNLIPVTGKVYNLPAGVYTFSSKEPLDGRYTVTIRPYYGNTPGGDKTISSSNRAITFNATNTITKLLVFIANFSAGTTFDETISLQLERGRTPTNFAPYFEPIELCKLSDGDTVYQDYIYKNTSDNKWYKHNSVRHYITPKCSEMNNGTQNYPGWTGQSVLTDDLGWGHNEPLANIVPWVSDGSVYPWTPLNFGVNGRLFMINPPAYNLTQDQWKSTYPDLRFNVYYGILNQTDTEITHQPLIDQLDALASTALYEGQNNITVSGDLAGYLNLTYNTMSSGVYVASMVNGAYILDDDTRDPAYAKAWIPYDLTYYNGEWYLMNMVGEVYIPDNSISGDKIVNGAITSSKIDWSTMNTGVLGQDVVIGTFLGKPLYCRVIKIERNGSTATGWKQFDMPAGMNIGWVKNAYGFGTNDGTTWFNANRPRQENPPYSMSISTVSNSKIDICIGSSMGTLWDYMYICVEYIKSTD